MRKLIILLLFLVFTVLAIGFVALPSFTLATNIKVISGEDADFAVNYANPKASVTVINNPVAGFLPAYAQICIIQVPATESGAAAGYLYILSSDVAVSNAVAVAAGNTVVSGAAVFMWLFTLLMIIFLPKKRSKRSVRRIAEDVVDDELDAQSSYRPSRGGKKGKKKKSYDYDDDED